MLIQIINEFMPMEMIEDKFIFPWKQDFGRGLHS